MNILRIDLARWTLQALLLACTLGVAPPLAAGQATPLIARPDVEARFNRVAHELRCLVCQNQTIADSRAGLAEDLRREILEMIEQGKSDDEIKQYMVQRYGDFILYRPPLEATTVVLWAAPFLALAGGAVILLLTLRRRRRSAPQWADAPLSEEESRRLAELYRN